MRPRADRFEFKSQTLQFIAQHAYMRTKIEHFYYRSASRKMRVGTGNYLKGELIMRVQLGKKPLVYPQPVLMVATYDEAGNPDLMTAAWGGVGDDTQIFLCLSEGHKTTQNLLKTKAFTVSMGVEGLEKECDYAGIVSANKEPGKLEKAGLHVHKSDLVNAPVVDELPLCLECELISYEPEHCHLFGEIVGVSADESILTGGKVDMAKLRPLIFDIDGSAYYGVGEKKADAFKVGAELK